MLSSIIEFFLARVFFVDPKLGLILGDIDDVMIQKSYLLDSIHLEEISKFLLMFSV